MATQALPERPRYGRQDDHQRHKDKPKGTLVLRPIGNRLLGSPTPDGDQRDRHQHPKDVLDGIEPVNIILHHLPETQVTNIRQAKRTENP